MRALQRLLPLPCVVRPKHYGLDDREVQFICLHGCGRKAFWRQSELAVGREAVVADDVTHEPSASPPETSRCSPRLPPRNGGPKRPSTRAASLGRPLADRRLRSCRRSHGQGPPRRLRGETSSCRRTNRETMSGSREPSHPQRPCAAGSSPAPCWKAERSPAGQETRIRLS